MNTGYNVLYMNALRTMIMVRISRSHSTYCCLFRANRLNLYVVGSYHRVRACAHIFSATWDTNTSIINDIGSIECEAHSEKVSKIIKTVNTQPYVYLNTFASIAILYWKKNCQ